MLIAASLMLWAVSAGPSIGPAVSAFPIDSAVISSRSHVPTSSHPRTIRYDLHPLDIDDDDASSRPEDDLARAGGRVGPLPLPPQHIDSGILASRPEPVPSPRSPILRC